jgi:ectoine hydroxylase-related dioxygenase (phytanoyl-CoA dioxygenase family)
MGMEGSIFLGYDTISLGNRFPAFHGTSQNPRPYPRESLKTHVAREYNYEKPGENTDTQQGLVAR